MSFSSLLVIASLAVAPPIASDAGGPASHSELWSQGPQAVAERPARVRLHDEDGPFAEGDYVGVSADRAFIILRTATNPEYLVERTRVVRIETLTEEPPPSSAATPAPAPIGPPAASTETAPAPRVFRSRRYTDQQLLESYKLRAVVFGLSAGASVAFTATMRAAYLGTPSEFECGTSKSGEEICSGGASPVDGLLLAGSWVFLGGGMAFTGLVGHNVGLASAIRRPDGPRPRRYSIAGASVLVAGLSYLFISRIPAFAGVVSHDRAEIARNEPHFIAASLIAYTGAGLLGFGVGKSIGMRRRLAITPALTPDGGMLMVSITP